MNRQKRARLHDRLLWPKTLWHKTLWHKTLRHKTLRDKTLREDDRWRKTLLLRVALLLRKMRCLA